MDKFMGELTGKLTGKLTAKLMGKLMSSNSHEFTIIRPQTPSKNTPLS